MLDEDKIRKYALNCYLGVKGYTLKKAADKFRMSYPKILYQYILIMAADKRDVDNRNFLLFTSQFDAIRFEYNILMADCQLATREYAEWINNIQPSEIAADENYEQFKIEELNRYMSIYGDLLLIDRNTKKMINLCETYGFYDFQEQYVNFQSKLTRILDNMKEDIMEMTNN